jgi:Ion channel
MSSVGERRARRGPGRRPHVLKRFLLAFVSPNSYGMVLLLIVATYSMLIWIPQSWTPVVVFVQIVTVWFALRTARAARVVRVTADLALVAATILVVFELTVGSGQDPGVRLYTVSAVLYLIAPVAMIRHIATRPSVDQETLLGAIGAYLMIGMCFAFAYRIIAIQQAGPFFGSGGEGEIEQVLFFSFTTLTTTGFGNYVPAENPGQALSVAEMLIGQLFLIIAVGKVIATWRPARLSHSQEALAGGGALEPDPDDPQT